MGYFIQQDGINVFVHKEIAEIFQIDKVKIVNLTTKKEEVRTINISDIFYSENHYEKCIYELLIYKYDEWLPIEKVNYDPDQIKKVMSPYPERIKFINKETKNISLIDEEPIRDARKALKRNIDNFDEKYIKAEESLTSLLKEKINEITNI